MIFPFEYPSSSHILRHGPSGYIDYESFRPWLRDEYDFLCVYCRIRESWALTMSFNIDHFVPQVVNPDIRANYENLVYSCPSCNFAKSNSTLLDPRQHLSVESVRVHEDGTIEGLTPEAREIIRSIGLDDPKYQSLRNLWIRIIQSAHDGNLDAPDDLYRLLMGYPKELPNLAPLRPKANSRPQGIEQSAHARRSRGELPDVY